MTKRASDFQKEVVSLSVGQVSYWRGGSGRPILYLHSAGGFRKSEALQDLANHHQVYAVLLPGFDGTPSLEPVRSMQDLAQLAAEFIQTVIGQPCDVIGHSFGGWTAAWLGVLHPELVEQLVLETPAGFRPEGMGGLGGPPEVLRQRMYAHPERIPAENKPSEVIAKNREMVHHYHGPASMDSELVARLGEIQFPTLILAGTKDGVIPVESVHLLKEKILPAYLCYIDDAAHNIEVDQPQRFVRVVRDFFTHGEAFLINWKNESIEGRAG